MHPSGEPQGREEATRIVPDDVSEPNRIEAQLCGALKDRKQNRSSSTGRKQSSSRRCSSREGRFPRKPLESREDERAIQKLMEAGDDDRVHSIGYEVLEMFKELPAWQAANALQLIYERNYCSICREEAVLALDQINAVPDIYREELPFDCSSFVSIVI